MDRLLQAVGVAGTIVVAVVTDGDDPGCDLALANRLDQLRLERQGEPLQVFEQQGRPLAGITSSTAERVERPPQ